MKITTEPICCRMIARGARVVGATAKQARPSRPQWSDGASRTGADRPSAETRPSSRCAYGRRTHLLESDADQPGSEASRESLLRPSQWRHRYGFRHENVIGYSRVLLPGDVHVFMGDDHVIPGIGFRCACRRKPEFHFSGSARSLPDGSQAPGRYIPRHRSEPPGRFLVAALGAVLPAPARKETTYAWTHLFDRSDRGDHGNSLFLWIALNQHCGGQRD